MREMIVPLKMNHLANFVTLPTEPIGAGTAIVYSLLTLANFQMESASSPTPYSKFSGWEKKSQTVTGRQAMLLIYLPSLLLAGYLIAKSGSFLDSNRESLVRLLVGVHFFKRTLETLFVHNYSGQNPLFYSCFIGAYYMMSSFMLTSLRVPHPNKLMSLIGVALFVVGQVGNGYHHYLLARLRKQGPSNGARDRKSQYAVPTGGLFELVAMPHYFFELLSWFGIALNTQHLNGFLLFTSMVSYLSGRSVATNEWNRANIQGYPKSRKNLVPFIF